MSITALAWAVLYGSAAVLSVFNPLFGALGYLLEYYMRPELKWWGHDLPALRYNLIISVVLGVTFLIRRGSLRELGGVPKAPRKWLLGLAAVMLIVTATVAVSRPVSWDWTVQWFKIAVVFPLLVTGVVRTTTGFDWFVMTNMLGASWWGYNAWTNPRRANGRLLEIGSGDSFNDNSAAAHLLTVLAFAVVYLLTEKDKRKRALAAVATIFVVNTLVLCNSRGATVALIATLGASFLLIRSGYRVRLVGTGVAMIALVLTMADPQFLTRQQTTTNYEQDSSAEQRLESWQAGFRMVRDHPLGVGGRGFHLLSPQYIPSIVESHNGDLRAPHNTWVMVSTEWGVAGLICFIGIYGSAFLLLQRVKRRATHQGFYYWRALAIQLAIVATLVAGAFTDRLYGESGYWMVGLACALYRLQAADAADTVPDVSAAPVALAQVPSVAGIVGS